MWWLAKLNSPGTVLQFARFDTEFPRFTDADIRLPR